MVTLDELELELGRGLVELASSLSIAAEVDPALLRVTRRRLHPELTHEAEAVLFHSPLAESRGHYGFALSEPHLAELRWRLLDEGRLNDARAVVEEVHAGAPALTRLEEELTYELLADENAAAIERLLGSVTAWLRDADDRRPVGRWILRAFRRAPEELLTDARFATQALSLVWAASEVLGGATLGHRAVAGGTVPTLPALTDRTMRVGVRLNSAGLFLSGLPESPTTIAVPNAWPVVLRIEEAGGESTAVTLHDPPSLVTVPVRLPATVSTVAGQRFLLGQRESSVAELKIPIDAVAWSDDRLAAASRQARQVLLLAPETLQRIRTIKLDTDYPPDQLALAPTGTRVAISAGDDVTVWTLPSGARWRVLRSRGGRVHALTFADDGGTLAGASDGGTAVWPLRAGKDFELEPAPGPLALQAGGEAIAVAGNEGLVVRQLTTEVPSLSPPIGLDSQASGLAWSPDGQTLSIGDRDGHVLVWRGGAAAPRGGEAAHDAPVEVLAFSPGQDLLASGDRAGVVHLWRVAEMGRPVQTWTGHDGRVRALAWSPDGGRVASGGVDGTLRTWDVLVGTAATPVTAPAPPSGPPTGEARMRLTSLPAAHGTSLILELGSPDRPFRIVVDGGPHNAYRQGLGPWVAARPEGERRIDLLAVTHTDESSIGGVLELLKDPSVVISDIWFNGWRQLSEGPEG